MVFEWLWRSPTQCSFKNKTPNSFHKRKEEALKARRRHPDKVPVVMAKAEKGGYVADLDSKKFLIPDSITLSEFQFLIRQRINLRPEVSLFFFVDGNTLVSMSDTMRSIYEEFHHEDFILYITYGVEATFG